MASQTQRPVLVLYEHALLGEGIARHLLAQIGVEATLAPAHDMEAVQAALALDPAVVIYELSEPLRQVDLSRLAPHAELIDLSMIMARGSGGPHSTAGMDRILQVVRDSSGPVSRPA